MLGECKLFLGWISLLLEMEASTELKFYRQCQVERNLLAEEENVLVMVVVSSRYYTKMGLSQVVTSSFFPRKQIWCNLIKRQDWKDEFKVSSWTFICHLFFVYWFTADELWKCFILMWKPLRENQYNVLMYRCWNQRVKMKN